MDKKKVVVIGAGFGGLGSAILMARAGYDVTVVEKNDKVGGRANLLEIDGYKWDMGPSWYLMPDAFDRYFTAIGRRVEDYLDLQKLEPSYRVFFKSAKGEKGRAKGYEMLENGTNYLDLYADVDQAAATFEGIESGSGDKLKNYLKSAAYQYGIAMDKFVFKNFDSIWDFMTPQLAIEGLQLNVFTKLYNYVSRFVKNENLKKLLMYPSVFLGTSPYQTPALFNIMSHVDFNQGVFYPQGGIHEIPKALYQIALEEGVNFQFNTSIDKILVDQGVVSGVQYCDHNEKKRIVNPFLNLPVFDENLTNLLSKLFFNYKIETGSKDIDCLIVMGSGKYAKYLAQSVNDLCLNNNVSTIILTGGIPKFSDSAYIEKPESQLIYEHLDPKVVDKCHIIIEDQSTNIGENIENIKNLYDFNDKNIWVVAKNFHVPRTIATIKKHLNIVPKLYPVSFAHDGDIIMDENTWSMSEKYQRLVFKEYQKLKTYSNLGYIDTELFDNQIKEIELYLDKLGYIKSENNVIPANIIISNADMRHTETQLLEPSQQTYPESYWAKQVISPSGFILYLGVDGKLPQLKHHTLVFSDDWKGGFDQIFQDPQRPQDPNYYICNPSKSDSSVAPAGKENLFVLVPIAPGLESTPQSLETYKDLIIADIAHNCGIPDLADRIEVSKIFSIPQFEQYYNAYKGTALGLAHTFFQSAVRRPQNYSKKVKGLYYVGGYTTPGIGMPMCLISAMMVADRVEKNKR